MKESVAGQDINTMRRLKISFWSFIISFGDLYLMTMSFWLANIFQKKIPLLLGISKITPPQKKKKKSGIVISCKGFHLLKMKFLHKKKGPSTVSS